MVTETDMEILEETLTQKFLTNNTQAKAQYLEWNCHHKSRATAPSFWWFCESSGTRCCKWRQLQDVIQSNKLIALYRKLVHFIPSLSYCVKYFHVSKRVCLLCANLYNKIILGCGQGKPGANRYIPGNCNNRTEPISVFCKCNSKAFTGRMPCQDRFFFSLVSFY